jgi:hypothetical protein
MNQLTTEMDQRIMLDDCCIKKSMKDIANTVLSKPLTDIQAIFLCLYQVAISTTLIVGIIRYQMAARCLCWAVTNLCPTNLCPARLCPAILDATSFDAEILVTAHLITIIALVINTMIVMQFIDNIKDLVFAMSCKCDHRQHPELEVEE